MNALIFIDFKIQEKNLDLILNNDGFEIKKMPDEKGSAIIGTMYEKTLCKIMDKPILVNVGYYSPQWEYDKKSLEKARELRSQGNELFKYDQMEAIIKASLIVPHAFFNEKGINRAKVDFNQFVENLTKILECQGLRLTVISEEKNKEVYETIDNYALGK